jgi:hypothetical protein
MSAMSDSRDVATKACSLAWLPATKREFFHASKYSDIVGVMITRAEKASASVGWNSATAASSS